MREFFEYLERKGVQGSRELAEFIRQFLKNPSIFYDLTDTARDEMGKKLDEALFFFQIDKGPDGQPRIWVNGD